MNNDDLMMATPDNSVEEITEEMERVGQEQLPSMEALAKMMGFNRRMKRKIGYEQKFSSKLEDRLRTKRLNKQ